MANTYNVVNPIFKYPTNQPSGGHFTSSQIGVYLRIGPWAVTVTTTGQHKRSTTKMLQNWFISNEKSQHIAVFKSDFFPTTPAEAAECHPYLHASSHHFRAG